MGDIAKFTDVIVARFRKCSDLVCEYKVFIKNKTKVVSGVGCSERGIIYFVQFLSAMRRNSVLEELRVRRLQSRKLNFTHINSSVIFSRVEFSTYFS